MNNNIKEKNRHWFQFLAGGILFAFMFLLFLTTFLAFARQSGVTKINMIKGQQLRYAQEIASNKTQDT